MISRVDLDFVPTLIHPQYVLTAAHCIAGDSAQYFESQGFDIYFISATNVYSELQMRTQTAISTVSSMEAHSGYNPNNTQSIRDDIGLMRLAQPIYNIDPIPLNTQVPNGSWSDIRYVGFGITGENNQNSSGVRRTVTVPLNNNSNQYWPYSTDDMFLYTWDPAGQTNICSGDSGGAAFRQLSNGGDAGRCESFGFDRMTPTMILLRSICVAGAAEWICTAGLPVCSWTMYGPTTELLGLLVSPVQNHQQNLLVNPVQKAMVGRLRFQLEL